MAQLEANKAFALLYEEVLKLMSPVVNGNNKWEGRIIIEIEAPTRKEAHAALKAMKEAYSFVEKPPGVVLIKAGRVTERKP